MIFQHAMLAAVVTVAERAVADYALSEFLAFFVRAAELLWGHTCACAKREEDVREVTRAPAEGRMSRCKQVLYEKMFL